MAMAGVGSSVPAKFQRAWALRARGNLGETVRGVMHTFWWLGWGAGGLYRRRDGKQRAGGEVSRDGGAPVNYGGGSRVEKLH